MDFSFLAHINYLTVLASSVVFFFLGSLWFSTLFGTMWVQELKRHNVTIKEPSKQELSIKMLITFGMNVLASCAMACLVILTGSSTVETGFTLGLLVAIGFAATTLATTFTWENRSLKLFLLDVGYPVLGIVVSAIILSVWM